MPAAVKLDQELGPYFKSQPTVKFLMPCADL